MEKSDFGKRLLKFCKYTFQTQVEFARKLNIKPQALQKYIKGYRLPLPDFLNRLYKLGCNINWLLSGEGEMIETKASPRGKTRLVPILAEVECGTPVYNQINQEHIKMAELTDVSHYNNPFIVIARGDSMRPYINPGDYLLCVDEPTKIKDGSAVVIDFKTIPETYSSNAKLIKFLKDDSIMLYSINTKFAPTIHKKSEIYKIYKVIRIIRDVK